MKRMTAEEVAAEFDASASARVADEYDKGRETAYERAADIVRGNLVPQWQSTPDVDGWHWLEKLDTDAPPQLLLDTHNGFWVRWTVSGWVPLVGRVCPIGARPR